MSKIDISIEMLPGSIKPKYAKPGDAGMDVYANTDVYIKPGEIVVIPVGFKVAIPEGYEIQVRPRSGLSFNTPLRVTNSPGTIDAGYRDEVGVIMQNTSNPIVVDDNCNYYRYDISEKGNKNGLYWIKKGDRIAQIVLQEVPEMVFLEVDDVTQIGNNRGGGLGSTGTR